MSKVLQLLLKVVKEDSNKVGGSFKRSFQPTKTSTTTPNKVVTPHCKYTERIFAKYLLILMDERMEGQMDRQTDIVLGLLELGGHLMTSS